MTQFHIGFDTSQKPRGRIDGSYAGLKRELESWGFGVWEYSSFPITRESLMNYDILVFACTDSSKFTANEIMEISTWVKEDGGGLLLLSHAGGDRGRRTNMSELASQFALIFENDQVLDPYHNFGIENMPEIRTVPVPHSISEGITSFCYRAGCSVSIVGIAMQVAIAQDTAEPPAATVIGASEPGEGRVVAIGSYEIFRDGVQGGLNHPYHKQLARNIFEWLVTGKRRALREGGTGMVPVSDAGGAGGFAPERAGAGVSSDHTSKLVQINSIHDLFQEIKNIADDVELLRARVQNVYKVVEMLDSAAAEQGDMAPATGELGAAGTTSSGTVAGDAPVAGETAANGTASPPASDSGTTTTSPDDLLSLIQAKKEPGTPGKVGGAGNGDAAGPSEPPAGTGSETTTSTAAAETGGSFSDLLTELKQEQVKKGEVDLDALKISQPGLGTVMEEAGEVPSMPAPEKKIEYELTPEDKRKSAAELDDEIEKLEAKLKSVENLKDFTERKFKDGKMDEERYKKDIKKFQDDIDLTRSKIEKYKELLASK